MSESLDALGVDLTSKAFIFMRKVSKGQITGGETMNSLNDVWEIVTEFHENTFQKVIGSTITDKPVQWQLKNRAAAKRTREIVERLNKLKLSPKDREHYSVLRKMFAEFIKCFEANAKGNLKESEEALEKAEAARVDYMKRRKIRP